MGCKQSTIRSDVAAPKMVAMVPTKAVEAVAEKQVEPTPAAIVEPAVAIEQITVPSIIEETPAVTSEPIAEASVPVMDAEPTAVEALAVEEPMVDAEPEVEAVVVPEAPVVAEIPASPMAEKSANVRRVAFDKETMRRTAPVTAPAPATKLTKKQQQMVQTGHKSNGRRGPVASKHSRCKGQMQDSVYLEMANAFERLLTNVNTIDAHLDSR
eukprot:GILI01001615.1.p1 GENE.GILI01001615.1~~GILI01001615.1.p1  ORF type:complete len:239 (-),score=83.39 GILI01001615.1:128-763(-)